MLLLCDVNIEQSLAVDFHCLTALKLPLWTVMIFILLLFHLFRTTCPVLWG